MINPKITEEIVKAGIEENHALLYLLAIYYNLKTDIIPEDVIRKVNLLKIVERSYDESQAIIWNVPLFVNQTTTIDANWEWISEYIDLFRKANPDRVGTTKFVLQRMKLFFSENPEVRKDDVIAATKIYISRTERTYIMKSHKFIFDGAGAMKNSTLLQYVEEVMSKKTKKSVNPNHKVIR